MVRAVPEAADLFEYQDYAAVPTVENASEFITTAFEQNPALWDGVRNYVEYIARRPGAERSTQSGHGLWNGGGKPVVLARAVDEAANHKGNLWTHVVSLRREDAERLGYNSAGAWRELVKSKLPVIAESMKIPLGELRWYGAFHNTAHHPHIHLIMFSQNPAHGFLTEPNISRMRSEFGTAIFEQDLLQIYERKDMARTQLNQFADERLKELAALPDGGDPQIARMLLSLGEQLRHTKGKKRYGYLKPALKRQADEIVLRLAADPRIDEMYRHWCGLSADVRRVYTGKAEAPPPLEHEQTFKTIKNIVVRQAAAAAEMRLAMNVPEPTAPDIAEQEAVPDDVPEPERTSDSADDMRRPSVPDSDAGPPLLETPPSQQAAAAPSCGSLAVRGAGALLRHLARMIQQDYDQLRQLYEHAVDRKLMAKIRRKKQDLGQRFSDE